MALVSLTEAKVHLNIVDDARNFDVDLKREHASGIILDYLKGRLIASISEDDPAEVETVIPHGLIDGSTVTIAGTFTEPTINGTQVITVTGLSTFTVPVAVTTEQEDVAGTVWRGAYTELTAPPQVKAATLLMLTHLYEHRGDDANADEALWTAIGLLLARSRDPALA